MKRILIADDEREIAEGIKDALRTEYEIDVATSALETLTLYRRGGYDALVLDVNFVGGMTGLEIATQIRQADRNIRILIFSAFDYSDSIRQHAVDIGAEFRQKPLDPSDLRSFLENHKADGSQ
jgi:two-component system response regulator YesN